MKYLAMIVIYTGFFGLIAGTVYLTGSAYCLWALLLCPTWKTRVCDKCGHVLGEDE